MARPQQGGKAMRREVHALKHIARTVMARFSNTPVKVFSNTAC